ncbi:MAG TPA: hypothetical protein VF077_08795 [Nitrospiraceae bacterium]
MTISIADGITLPEGTVTPPPPPGGTPGYDPNSLTDGGQVIWEGGYNFTVTAAAYNILGVSYTSPQTAVTLATAHATLDRIDVFAVNTSGQVVVVQGTPAVTPTKPDIDPTSQLELTFAYVRAATGPVNLSSLTIYQGEGADWTTTTNSAGTINIASTNNPRGGTHCIEGTAVVANNYVQFVAPGSGDITNRNNLVLFIWSKGQWPNNKTLTFRWFNGATPVGVQVPLFNGQFGFVSGTTTFYQGISIPLSVFNISGLSVDTLRATCLGSGGSIGFYIDDVSLQGGLANAGIGNVLRWAGETYSAIKQYNTYDVINADTGTFLANQPLIGVSAPGTGWIQLGGSGGGGGPEGPILRAQMFR